jgi:hypothetical protein
MSELVEQASMQLTPLQKVALLKERKNILHFNESYNNY